MAYSQNNEESYIVDFFGSRGDGKFIDIGAYDGKTFSNTYKLVELGWGGVCVEPSPSVLDALRTLHQGNKKISILEAAIGREAGKMTFFDSGGDAISTFDNAHKAKWEKGFNVKFKPVEVEVLTVDRLFEMYGHEFDFINLDVEALNWDIFNDIAKHFGKLSKLKLICVEHDNRKTEMTSIARYHGFRQIMSNAENVILGRD